MRTLPQPVFKENQVRLGEETQIPHVSLRQGYLSWEGAGRVRRSWSKQGGCFFFKKKICPIDLPPVVLWKVRRKLSKTGSVKPPGFQPSRGAGVRKITGFGVNYSTKKRPKPTWDFETLLAAKFRLARRYAAFQSLQKQSQPQATVISLTLSPWVGKEWEAKSHFPVTQGKQHGLLAGALTYAQRSWV